MAFKSPRMKVHGWLLLVSFATEHGIPYPSIASVHDEAKGARHCSKAVEKIHSFSVAKENGSCQKRL